MSIKSKVLGAAATLALVGGVVAFEPDLGHGRNIQVRRGVHQVFSPRFGSSAQPNFVESVRHGEVKVGQAIILGRASSTDPAGDFLPLRSATGGLVSDFFAAGMVSALSTAISATFPPCSWSTRRSVTPPACAAVSPRRRSTMKRSRSSRAALPAPPYLSSIPLVAPASEAGNFAIIDGSTTDFSHPFSMTYRHEPPARIRLEHLNLSDNGTAPVTQLWGRYFGVVS